MHVLKPKFAGFQVSTSQASILTSFAHRRILSVSESCGNLSWRRFTLAAETERQVMR